MAAAIAATFLVAGIVKGVIGLGLPTVSLAVLTVVSDLPSAMALLLVPSFVTNAWQAWVGGNATAIVARLWPFLSLAMVTVWLGARALTTVDLALLSALLGTLLLTYATAGLVGWKLTVSARDERWVGPLAGTANGLLTGMTGSFVVPGVMFLSAIGLARDSLIQAMGILFTASTVALAVALRGHDLVSLDHGIWSTAAVAPALAGMVIGQRLRQRLSEELFRRVFFVALLALGGYIIVASLGSRL